MRIGDRVWLRPSFVLKLQNRNGPGSRWRDLVLECVGEEGEIVATFFYQTIARVKFPARTVDLYPEEFKIL